MIKISRIKFTALISAVLVVGMIGMAYASVPLYRLFCQVTGFAGVTQRAEIAPTTILDRKIIVQFDSNVHPNLDWTFSPSQRQIELNIGEKGLAFYTARNVSNKQLRGSAVFNVTPIKAGYFFNKIDCFCFVDQVLDPGEEVQMPVTFFIDPEIGEDNNMKDVKVITLSYTFFEKKDDNISNKRLEENDTFMSDLILTSEKKGS